MATEWLYYFNEWLLGLVILGLLLLATEGGFRLGRRDLLIADDRLRGQIGTLQAAILGLLGLLLGFSFSMAVNRYELRKELVVTEANAIGTASLRAQLLAPPVRAEAERLWKEYVTLRMEMVRLAPRESVRFEELRGRCEAIHADLWRQATAAARADPRSVPAGLYLAALNVVIDTHASRITAYRNHVPEAVFLLLLGVAGLAMGCVGYGAGQTSRRLAMVTMSTCALFAVVIVTIMDLDRPQRGMIQVSQEPMIRLQQQLNEGAAP
ncbi:MAG: hypothetical protein U0736_00495 [Gemmataceae bacterium]